MKEQDTININENNFDAGILALYNAFRYLFTILGVVIVLLIIWFFSFGGAFTVETHERVLIMNFGVLEEKAYEPGWHWNWPYPVTEIVRLPGPESIQSLKTEEFWFFMDPNTDFKSDSYMNMTELVPGKDGYILTGDANIIHGVWTMYYRIQDPVKYFKECSVPENPFGDDTVIRHPEDEKYFGTRGPKTLLKDTLDNTLIKLCATEKIDYVWKNADFHKDVKTRVKNAVEELDIGVVVDDVAFDQRPTPPMGALYAFSAVTKAKLTSATYKLHSENYAVRQKNEAESESAKIIADANTYKIQVLDSIKSQSQSFKDHLIKYRENPKTFPVALYSDALAEVITSADDIFILRSNDKGNQQIRILLNREPENESEKNNEKKDGE